MPITLDGTLGITTPTYGGADAAEYLVPVTAFKNRIINGAMVINQRGVVVTNPNPSYVTDRWNAVAYGSCTVEQSSTAPTGFTNSLLWTTTSASAPSAGQWAVMNQGIEGFNVADLGWGAAGAQTVTLSFWVRSSTTGTYSVGLGNATVTTNLPSTQTRSYVATYTVNAANTWEQKTITVTGDTTGTWLKTNGLGLCVTFDCGSGTTYQTSTLNSWQSGAFWRATGSVGIANTSSGTLAITGVQLEVGTNATSFDARSYGTELALCQRYCFGYGGGVSGGGGGSQSCAFGIAFSTSSAVGGITFPVAMRTAPSVSVATVSNFFVNNLGSNTNATNITANSTSPLTSDLLFSLGSSPLTTNTPIRVFGNGSSLAIFSAEL